MLVNIISLAKHQETTLCSYISKIQDFLHQAKEALFSTAQEAKMFKNQMDGERRKGAIKTKPIRMEPQADTTFPIPTCQTTLDDIEN